MSREFLEPLFKSDDLRSPAIKTCQLMDAVIIWLLIDDIWTLLPGPNYSLY